jgi:Flp pilus assembly protein TadD
MRLHQAHVARLVVSAAIATCVAMAMAGCTTTGSGDTTGSIGSASTTASEPRTEADWRHEVDVWADHYKESPDDPQVALRYARALRATTQRAQAVAVLERAVIQHPQDRALLGAYGRALAETGNYAQALDVLGRAHTPEQPDWRILSAQGVVLDQLGRFGEAQRHYSAALKIVPDEPSVLSNLGLSYALARDLKRAEATLRRAAAQPKADPRARQNLALVVGLQGRFAEAEEIAKADLPPDEAEANVSYLRSMLADKEQLKKFTGQGETSAPAPAAQRSKKPRDKSAAAD